MIENHTAIIIVAYNRPRSLARLLSSLNRANYPNNGIELIISIDRSDDNQEVLDIANSFDWVYGKKIVKYQEVNLGLRKHILQCGDLTATYDSVIVLEDDLYVAPNFYFFATNALDFSNNENRIGGVSLYNHQLNVHTKDSFSALEDGFDNWYFQFASSWGQAWTKKQWFDFKDWYKGQTILKESSDIPSNVSSWSEKSWLKFYIAYLIEKDLYFLYPKISLSTNFSDAGTHVGSDTTNYQVPLYKGEKKEFSFSKLSKSKSTYDAFFENVDIPEVLGYSKDELSVDLYGYKEKKRNRYWLTTKKMDFKIIKTFGRSLKPLDMNILENIAGKDFLLYDTEISSKNEFTLDTLRKITYNVKYVSFEDSKKLYSNHIKMKCIRILRKLGISR